MKHLIVVSHPSEGSLTMAVAHAYAAQLEELGHSQRMHDLYRLDFDPVLTTRELVLTAAENPPCSDVAWAQDEVRSADALCVIYPLWWMAMPAMMKGYIDRVFARGFAYELKDNAVHGLLSGKKAVLITLSGAPMAELEQAGDWDAVQALQDKHVFRAMGFTLLEHLHFDEIVPELSHAVVQKHLARVRTSVQRLFPAR